MASMEEKVEEYFKAQLDSLKIRHYGKTELINRTIDALLLKRLIQNQVVVAETIQISKYFYRIRLAGMFL